MLKLPSGGAVRYPDIKHHGPMTQYFQPAHTKMLSTKDVDYIHKTTSDMMDHELTAMEKKITRKRTAASFSKKEEATRIIQRAKLHEIVGPRSAQGLITISAVFEPPYTETKTLPAHSLAFAADPAQKGGHVKIKNFDTRRFSWEMPPPIVGVTLEDALDAPKTNEHISRRTVAIGVGGVVALHCPVQFAKEFIFGDPVFVTSDPLFQMPFNDITILVPSNTVTGASYCKIGTFVEQIDAQRGGIRLKLDIGEWWSDNSEMAPYPAPLSALPGVGPAAAEVLVPYSARPSAPPGGRPAAAEVPSVVPSAPPSRPPSPETQSALFKAMMKKQEPELFALYNLINQVAVFFDSVEEEQYQNITVLKAIFKMVLDADDAATANVRNVVETLLQTKRSKDNLTFTKKLVELLQKTLSKYCKGDESNDMQHMVCGEAWREFGKITALARDAEFRNNNEGGNYTLLIKEVLFMGDDSILDKDRVEKFFLADMTEYQGYEIANGKLKNEYTLADVVGGTASEEAVEYATETWMDFAKKHKMNVALFLVPFLIMMWYFFNSTPDAVFEPLGYYTSVIDESGGTPPVLGAPSVQTLFAANATDFQNASTVPEGTAPLPPLDASTFQGPPNPFAATNATVPDIIGSSNFDEAFEKAKAAGPRTYSWFSQAFSNLRSLYFEDPTDILAAQAKDASSRGLGWGGQPRY